jgi:hypothetical protein
MASRNVSVDHVRKGMAVSGVVYAGGTPGPIKVRQTKGQWPTVVSCKFRRNGEDDKPTHYLVLSDSPQASFPLHKGDQVVIEDGERR